MTVYYSPRFANLEESKRESIFNAALNEFARKGFHRANINFIAENCDISVGSLYKYFESKEYLFLALIDEGFTILESILNDVFNESGSFLERIEKLVRAAIVKSEEYTRWIQVYQDMMSEGVSHLAVELSARMEGISSTGYRKMIRDAVEEGVISKDVDPGIAAFCIDNIILGLQFSGASTYYKKRMSLFLNNESKTEDELVEGVTAFIMRSLE
jgi:TetR/AcrR family transcriptional regulator